MSAQLRGKVSGEAVLGGQGARGFGETPQDAVDRLIGLSLEAKMHAYCPYSKFRVGAALLAHDDKFGSSWEVYLSKPDGSHMKMNVSELLPLSFGPEELSMKKVFLEPNEC
ncbi:hypothetical protein CRUP_031939 [Coryphaenoides rupestris]|nr:hypothetical protein CRUP_031939 [Coryphaenoides rupestris]